MRRFVCHALKEINASVLIIQSFLRTSIRTHSWPNGLYLSTKGDSGAYRRRCTKPTCTENSYSEHKTLRKTRIIERYSVGSRRSWHSRRMSLNFGIQIRLCVQEMTSATTLSHSSLSLVSLYSCLTLLMSQE